MGVGRRTFLKLSVGTVVFASVAAAWAIGPDRRAALIRAVLDKRPGDRLLLDPEGVDRFVSAYEAQTARLGDLKHKLFAGLIPLYSRSGVLDITPAKDVVWWLERDIVEAFLMGSDFFFDVAGYEQGQRPLVFNEFYDPKTFPCSNPFTLQS